MYKEAPALARLDAVEPRRLAQGVEALAGTRRRAAARAVRLAVRDFYLTNPIARASAVMAELSALKKSMRPAAATAATHG